MRLGSSLCLIFLGLILIPEQGDARKKKNPVPEALRSPKAKFEQKLDEIRGDASGRILKLNDGYARGLETLMKELREEGHLDPFLAAQKERDRFRASHRVADTDLDASLDQLARMQRLYIDRRGSIDRELQLKEARLAKSYVSYLDKLKRTLTQQNDIETALMVSKEQETIRRRIDLSVLEAKKEPAPRTEHASPSRTPGPAARPYQLLKAPRDKIWVFTMKEGRGERGINCAFLSNQFGNKIEIRSDIMGKISLHAAESESYRVLLISPGWKLQQIEEATPGNSYRFDLEPAPVGTGLAEVSSSRFTIPNFGEFRLYGSWSSSTGGSGPVLKSYDEGYEYHYRGRWSSTSLHATTNELHKIKRGSDVYAIRILPIGPKKTYFIEYRKENGAEESQ